MPTFKYLAKDMAGKTVKGTLDVANVDALLGAVRGQRQFLLSYEAVEKSGQRTRLSGLELSDFNRQLGTMLSSGITLLRSLEILLRRDMPPKKKLIYEKLYTSLISGISLSDAMEAQGQVFPQLLINMYRAAEANGTVDLTAMRMAEHYEKEHKLAKKVQSASTYPLILLILTALIVVALFTFVLPNFSTLLGDRDSLPAVTRFLMDMSHVFTTYPLYILGGVVLLIISLRALLSAPPIRLRFDRLKLRLPVIGRLLRIIVTARFSRTLTSLYSSGLSIVTALQIARGTVGNRYIASQFDGLIANVRNGMSLAEALDRIEGFDKKLSSTVMVGEETGRLESVLGSLADGFDYEANEATSSLLQIMEPVMIIIMAAIIGTVLISVMLPIFSSYGTLAGGTEYGF